MNRRIRAMLNQPYSHWVKFTFIKKSLPDDYQNLKAWKLTSGTYTQGVCETEERSSHKFL